MAYWPDWKRWVNQPQTAWLRKALFQVHLWSGIGVGLYMLMISVTGSVLVFRNELAEAATREPIIITATGPRLSEEELTAAATRAYPGYSVGNISHPPNPDQAVSISLRAGRDQRDQKDRLFDPYTGQDLGDAVPFGIWSLSKLLALHDDLFAGRTGRSVNGIGALMLIVLALTGMVIWWPGIRTWRRGLMVHRNVGWRRFTWDLHSMVGFWSLAFILVFAVSGAYLGNPEPFTDFADWLQPMTPENAGNRLVDKAIYWIAYFHFGRINGVGIPCHSRPGFCDWTTKVVWALFGLAPAIMFVTGAVMWWNRVLRKKLRRASLV